MHRLDIELQPSRLFVLLLSIILLGSFIIIFSLPIIIWIKLILVILIIFYGAHIFFLHGVKQHKKSIRKLSLTNDNWIISDLIGEYPAELCGSSTVTTLVSILRFKIADEKCKRTCVVFRDSVTKDQYRKMIIYAKGK